MDKAIVSFHAKATDATNIDDDGPFFGALNVCGSGVGFSGCGGAVLYRFNSFNSTGNTVGTTCYDLTFDDAAPTKFNPPGNPAKPFVGTFKWPETELDEWRLGSLFEFRNSGGTDDYQLQCLKVVFVTKIVTP